MGWFYELYKAYRTKGERGVLSAILLAGEAWYKDTPWILTDIKPAWCRECGYVYPLPLGKCPVCGADNRYLERKSNDSD